MSCLMLPLTLLVNIIPLILFIYFKSLGIDLSQGAGQPTEVLCLMNMVVEEELREEEEYEGWFLALSLSFLYHNQYFLLFIYIFQISWKTSEKNALNTESSNHWKYHDQYLA